MTSTEEWDARFERDGETAVRDSLAAGSYLDDTAKLAREWLRRRDQAASEAVERDRVASNLEQIRLARAAWMAATAAIIVGICAVIVSLHK
jgi:hypothetical protein